VLACIERAMLANISRFSMKQLQNVTHVLTGSFQCSVEPSCWRYFCFYRDVAAERLYCLILFILPLLLYYFSQRGHFICCTFPAFSFNLSSNWYFRWLEVNLLKPRLQIIFPFLCLFWVFENDSSRFILKK